MIAADTRGAHRKLEAHLRPFVARRVSVAADVDDVLQEVHLRMHRGLATLRDEDRFGPWVYRVARSAIADHRRAQRRHPLGEGREEVQEIVDESEPPGAPWGDAEELLSHYVAPFVTTLPSPYREALTLTELSGLSQLEAARMLGIPASTMKSRVQRGRARLRDTILACCEVALDARGRVVGCEPRVASREGSSSASPGCACDAPPGPRPPSAGA